MERKEKIAQSKPCCFQLHGKITAIDMACRADCDRCGFNPKEQERRIKTGHFESIGKTRSLHFQRRKGNA